MTRANLNEIRQRQLALTEAQKGLEIFHTIPLRLVEVDLSNALSIANQIKLYAYDAYFLDCAVRHSAPLLTLDRGLERAARKLGVKLLEV